MISKEQIEKLKNNIDKFSKSEEQFIIIIFKNPDGTDNITGYSYNMPSDKIRGYLKQELMRGSLYEEKD